MDIDIGRWILEFLLRQRSLNDHTVNALVRVLPISDNDSSLKKSMLLRKIESEIAKGTVSESILELLEQIEELDCREGLEVSEAMKAAYCDVAVHCTVRFLEGSEDEKEGKYFDAVKRIWRGRVCEMERFEMPGVGLISEGLKIWKDEIEAGVWDPSVGENVLLRNKGRDALETVRVYVADAKEKMGPSFLELVAETLSDETLREVFGLGKDGKYDEVKESAPSVPNDGRDVGANSSNKETHKEIAICRRKLVASKRSRGAIAGTSRGAKIVDVQELVAATSHNRYGCPPTSEVNKVQEALEASSLELHAVVKDPLPDALRLAESVISSMARENMVCEPAVGNNNRVDVDAPSSSVDRSADALQANGGDLGNGCFKDQNKGPKSTLMARNNTARTIEWDDSINSSAEGSPRRPHLQSLKKRAVSPLKKYETTKLSRRRKVKRWSTLEEDTLRNGVQKYGKGNWKLILSMYPDIFEERTEVDLKDKWRNMVRY